MMDMTIRLVRTHRTLLSSLNTARNEVSARCTDAAVPFVHGSVRSPSRSRTKIMTSRARTEIAAATIAVVPRPKLVRSTPVTAAVAAQPMVFPKLMKALRRPCSLTGVRSIDMPSTATSWVAAKLLMSTPTSIKSPICSTGSSISMSANKASDRPSCAPSTHGLLLPIGRNS